MQRTGIEARHQPRRVDASRVLLERGWLAEQPEPFRLEMARRCVVRRYGKGETIFRRGDAPGGIYGIAAGTVAFHYPRGARGTYFADMSQPGAWFGEPSMFRRMPRLVTAVAGRDTVLLHLTLASFDEMVAREPASWRSFAVLAVDHNEFMLRLVSDLRAGDPKQRIAARLLALLDEARPLQVGEEETLTVTQAALAAMSGLSRNTVNRVLEELERAGVVEPAYGRIKVRDSGALSAIVAQDSQAEATST